MNTAPLNSVLNMAVYNTRSICNKISGVLELLSDKRIDVCFTTETWLKLDDKAIFAEIRDYGYDILSSPRRGRGGGVAFVYNPQRVKLIRNNVCKFSSFEVLEAILKTSNEMFRLCVIYRSTSAKKYAETRQTLFYKQFEEYLDLLITKAGKPIICGDFNFHLEDKADPSAKKFKSLYKEKGFKQHNFLPTFGDSSILDLILTQKSITDLVEVNNIRIQEDSPSDHHMLYFEVPANIKQLPSKTGTTVTTKNIRSLSKINIEDFKEDISKYLPEPSTLNNLDDIVIAYDTVLTDLLDKHAPCKPQTFREGKQPWWSPACQEARRARRAAERVYRKDRYNKSSTVKESHQVYKECQIQSAMIINKERNRYYTNSLSATIKDPKATYKVINKLLDKQYGSDKLPNGESDVKVANNLQSYFQDKIHKIYQDITANIKDAPESAPKIPRVDHRFTCFKFMLQDEVALVIKEMGTKSCESDPIPTWLFKNCMDELLPYVTLIVNLSLQTGSFPDNMKSAIVRATIKKAHLDADDLKNYRPISNLSFLSKVIEKCVHKQLTKYITDSSLYAEFQSGYRKAHSCETAVLKIHNDILLMVDKKKHVILMLLDLTAAFDTINHELLINKLKRSYGLDGHVINWIRSYLSERSVHVVVNGKKSESSWLTIGVPQGSILGPLLFILYTKELEDIARSYGFHIHLYADDTQIYFAFDPRSDDDPLQKLIPCFRDIKDWMSKNYLKMNDTKTEIIELHGFKPRSDLIQSYPLDTDCIIRPEFDPSLAPKNLGFYFDSKLNLDTQLQKVSTKCYINLRNLGRIGRHLTKDLKVQLVHSTVLSIMDNGNATYGGITSKQLNILQKIQNAAVRFVFGLYGKQRREHISPYLKELHFLPVYYRIRFKIALLVFKCLNNLAPKYLADMIMPKKCSTQYIRRYNDFFLLESPPCPAYIKTYGAFTYSAPSTWNELPYGIRCKNKLSEFKIALKTHYFRKAFKDSEPAMYDDIELTD